MAGQKSLFQGMANLSPDEARVSKMDTKPSLGILMRVIRHSGQARRLIPVIIILAILGCSFQVAAPYFINRTIDFMAYAEGVDFYNVMRLIGILALFFVISGIFLWVMNYLSGRVAATTAARLRTALYEKADRLPIAYFDKATDGDLEARMTYDVETIADGLLQGIAQFFVATVTIFGTLIFMLIMSVKMTLIILPVALLTLFIAMQIAKKTSGYFVRQQKAVGRIHTLADEYFSGQREVKLYRFQKRAQTEFETASRDVYEKAQKAQFYSSLPNPSTRLMNYLSYIMIVTLGFVFAGLTVGRISAFILYWNNFSRPVNDFTNITSQIMAAFASARRVFEILDLPETETDPQMVTPVASAVEGSIVFDRISFSYSSQKKLIEDMNIKVHPGQTVAIVGPTGAGKTTLMNLLLRFYDPVKGRILLDDKDIQSIEKDLLRSHFGIVLQDSWFFSGTVRENLRLGAPDASNDNIERVARAAHAHGFISRLPEGYGTRLENNASRLSQGQKQLLAIARVMLFDPQILILDEATRSVDSLTEARIRKGFDALMQGRTSFVIAHRLSTIRSADLIIVMDEGRIVEQGTHEALLACDGFYGALYHSRNAEISPVTDEV